MNYLDIRKKYPVFEYRSFDYEVTGEDLIITWEMGTSEIVFKPQIIIKQAGKKIQTLDKNVLNNLIFNLGLIEMFSYWKATCSPVIKISAGRLNQEQVEWWNELLIKGMGQYYYENKINFTQPDFVKFEVENSNESSPMAKSGDGSLIAVSGGKDSAVTLEIFKQNSTSRIGAFIVHSLRKADAALRIAKNMDTIQVWREIDPKLLELNQKGFLNGHTPIVAYLSFLSVLCAYIFGYKEIVFSNERSSNEGNVDYLGVKINHQIDKSFWFESKFRKYNQKFLSEIDYYSFLRPLYELQTMKIFAKMDKYFCDFRSCNVGSKTDSWCGNCPKCLAVYLGLCPFVKKEQLLTIFGENLLEKPSLKPVLEAMLGKTGERPLECIGTIKETQAALDLYGGKNADNIFISWDNNNFVPVVKQKWLI